MKNMWLVFFIVFNTSYAQIEQDKIYHFAAGTFASAFGYTYVYDKTNDKLVSTAAGFGFAILAGIIKETIDSRQSGNYFDTKDLQATALGGLSVSVVINIDNLFNKMKKRKLNSTNPKYQKIETKNAIQERKELIASNKKMKAYAIFEIE